MNACAKFFIEFILQQVMSCGQHQVEILSPHLKALIPRQGLESGVQVPRTPGSREKN